MKGEQSNHLLSNFCQFNTKITENLNILHTYKTKRMLYTHRHEPQK